MHEILKIDIKMEINKHDHSSKKKRKKNEDEERRDL